MLIIKSNVLESVALICIAILITSIAFNFITGIVGIIPLVIFCTIIFISSITLSFKTIQWLLNLNKPIKYHLDVVLKVYPYFKFILPKSYFSKKKKSIICEYDTSELSVISSVLERRLVSTWYVPYISEEIGFPFACKQILDQIIGKAFQISNNIEVKDVYVDLCSILVSHFKEYRRAVKRHEKSSGTVNSYYKKSHIIFDNTNKKKYQSGEHCTNVLRLIFKDLVPWELWDTPHTELLLRILAKKLDDFISSTLADPVWLNDKLLSTLTDKSNDDDSPENTPKLNETESFKFDTVDLVTDNNAVCNKELPKVITEDTESIIKNDIMIEKDIGPLETISEVQEMKGSQPVEIQPSPQMRQRRGRSGRNEVKIYDRLIEGSVKTWETDMDLQCISLGQDLLASLDGEITLSRLWEQDANESNDGWSPNPQAQRKSPQPLWFGEEDIEIELNSPQIETSPKSPKGSPKTSPKLDHGPKLELGPNPADALLKDLQSTVSQAKHKIGDLQVATYSKLDVPHKQSGDEAAGMMEGLLDFGIAGLKKGLRFTGLHDDTQEKSPSHNKERNLERSTPTPTKEKVLEIDIDHFGQREDHTNSVPPLIKQNRVSSQDSLMSQPRLHFEPPVQDSLNESPEPEYEESADLSSSIAKLRSLLHQGTSDSPPGICTFAAAEETRGRTQRYPSSRPVDTASLADEYDMTADRISLPEQTTNNIQRLDKLLQRTVTGVFNSIRTAVGAEGDEISECLLREMEDREWSYVCTSMELSVGCAVARLVGSRRSASVIDAALDSLHHLEPRSPPKQPPLDTDDYDEWCSSFGAGATGLAEVVCAVGIWESHVAHRISTILLADMAECIIDAWLKEFTMWLRKEIFVVFEAMSKEEAITHVSKPKELREFNIEQTCEALINNVPGLLQMVSKEALSKAALFAVSSFSHKDINKDLAFRLLDISATHLKKSASVRDNSFDI